MEIIIKGIKLIQTCGACPEQYDAFDDTGKKVGYLRLRWGCFEVRVPGPGPGKEVYFTNIGDGLTGMFTSEEERMEQLTKAVKAIKKELKKKNETREPFT